MPLRACRKQAHRPFVCRARVLSVPPPLACSHRLNGLPVQRSVIHARCPGRGGRQAVSRQSSTQVCYTLTLGWPTLILASRRRRYSQFPLPWRVMINGHVLKLGVETGYQAHFRLIGVSAQSRQTRRSHVTDLSEPQNSEYDNLGSDRQVAVVVPGAVDVQMDAAM
jgi:hypothetical protein